MSDIRVSDTIVVRDWDDMVEEYGTDPSGHIAIIPSNGANSWYFMKAMRCLCGKEVVVTAKNPHYNVISIKPVIEDDSEWSWNFCPEMFREPDEILLDFESDLNSILSKVE